MRQVFNQNPTIGATQDDGADDPDYQKFMSGPLPPPREEPVYETASSVRPESSSTQLSTDSSHIYERPRSSGKGGARTSNRSSGLYAYISDGSSMFGGSTQTINSLHVGGTAHISSPLDDGFSARLTSLSKMLDEEDGVQALVGFAAKCFSLEYVLFWLDCEQFRNFDGTFEDLKWYAELIARKWVYY